MSFWYDEWETWCVLIVFFSPIVVGELLAKDRLSREKTKYNINRKEGEGIFCFVFNIYFVV